ncbi:MAG: MEKHLA domain-containing protein [Terriglobales bacterium]
MRSDFRLDQDHARLLNSSYQRWTGRSLLPSVAAGQDLAQALFDANFSLVSHGTEIDPVFNYGNATALRLFEKEWAAFTQRKRPLTSP